MQKRNISFDLISDTQGDLCNVFGVLKEKSMFGKTYLGIERSTFIIDEEGHLIKDYRKVKVEGHAEQVLNFLKES